MDKAKKIKELREKTGMSRREFCDYFDIPYRTVTEWERDTRHAPDYVVRLLEAGNKSADAYYNQVCTYCGRFFSSYGKNGRKYCCHDCYIMDRFWSDGDKDRVVAKNPDRKTIKIAL